jgi:hypothetical protein
MATNFKVDEKTYRKWIWIILKGIASLTRDIVSHRCLIPILFPILPSLACSFFLRMQIKLSNRFKGDTHQVAVMVVDGIDFKIQEQRKEGFSKAWYSFKHNGPGIRYELATCINTGDIVWIHGPFPCGSHPDLKIYRLGLKTKLLRGEKVVADRGYRGDRTVVTPFTAVSDNHTREMEVARARHETVNGRFTTWSALKDTYRHNLSKHHLIYQSVAVITQLEFLNGYGPFQCTSQHNSAIKPTED